MRLLDLIQQDHRIGLAPHLFSQLTALLVPHIARRRADHTGHGVLLHIFGHIDANHAVLVTEQRFSQSLAQLSLAHAGGPKEDERADGALRVLQTGPCTPYGPGDGGDGLLLADHPLMQHRFQVDESSGFILGDLRHGNARPGADDLGNLFLAHRLHAAVAAVFPFASALCHFVLQRLLLVPQVGGLFEVLVGHGFLCLLVQRVQLLLLLLHVRRRGEGLDTYPGGGFVDQVDGLVRQAAV